MLSKSNMTGKHYWYGKKITEAEYNEILSMLHNIPTAPEGYSYRLTSELEWELYELSIEETPVEEPTESDYQNALREMGVQV
jgi:hypothetical protein